MSKLSLNLKTEFTDADLLKAMRNGLGMSQEAFGQKIGMSRQQLSAYENGHHTAGIKTMADIASRAGLRLTVNIERTNGSDETPSLIPQAFR